MGSTTEIVRQCIDQLSLEPQPTPPAIPGVTEIQRYEFTEFAPLIDDLREISLREAALTQGLTFPEAEHELKVLQELLAQLGQLRVAAADTEQGFEYRMELQPVEDKSCSLLPN